MRTDDATPTNPEHEALFSRYYNRAVAGDDLDAANDLTSLIGTTSYARTLPDGRVLMVDVGPDGSHMAGVFG